MCGIFGYIGTNEKLETLISGLKSLEYRGYDSAGIAFFKEQTENNLDNKQELKTEIVIRKQKGRVEELEKIIATKQKFNVGIAHTRWATHGEPSAINAHPHISYRGNFCIVHNGIIENYQELKNTYLSNIQLKSVTDSEIIAHLLEKFYCGEVQKSLKKVISLLKGSYALAVMSTFEPNKLYLAKKSSPLLFGLAKNGIYFSSDVNTLGLYSTNFIKLEDNDFAILEGNSYLVYNKDVLQNPPLQKFWEENRKKQNVGCYMDQEIAESSLSILKTAQDFENQFRKIPKQFFENINKIILVACGSAYHSCLVGKKFFEQNFDIPILTEIASEFVYSNAKIGDKTLLIAVSQSGETADTLLALRKAKKQGAKTLAITNNPTSTIIFETHYSILMRAGWEKAVASTKAYVCQIAVFYLLAKALNGELKEAEQEIESLYVVLDDFNFKSWANKMSQELPKYEKIIFIGRGLSYFTAMEASLKLKEITYINSIAVASGELKHGTLALVDEKTLVVAIFCEEMLKDKNASTLEEISARGGNLLVISPFCKKKKSGGGCKYKGLKPLKLPNFKEELYTIIAILPLQKLACRVSQNFGYNPDMPKNLSKSVTVE